MSERRKIVTANNLDFEATEAVRHSRLNLSPLSDLTDNEKMLACETSQKSLIKSRMANSPQTIQF